MACQRRMSQDVTAATWNVRSIVGGYGDVVDALHRRNIDLCCAQETRWKCDDAWFFWQGCNKGTAGGGVFNAERWTDSVVDVVRVNERIMYVKLEYK